jgi:hypothetical protein
MALKIDCNLTASAHGLKSAIGRTADANQKPAAKSPAPNEILDRSLFDDVVCNFMAYISPNRIARLALRSSDSRAAANIDQFHTARIGCVQPSGDPVYNL